MSISYEEIILIRVFCLRKIPRRNTFRNFNTFMHIGGFKTYVFLKRNENATLNVAFPLILRKT